jgi:hypothetical protein
MRNLRDSARKNYEYSERDESSTISIPHRGLDQPFMSLISSGSSLALFKTGSLFFLGIKAESALVE